MRESILRLASTLFTAIGIFALAIAVLSLSSTSFAAEPLGPAVDECGCPSDCSACTSDSGHCGTPTCPGCDCVLGEGFNYACIYMYCP